MSGGGISTISSSSTRMFSSASMRRRNRKSTAKRLGLAMRLPASWRKFWYGRLGAHHDDRARAMAERNDLDRNALVRQIHHQRRQHVAGLDAAGHERLLDLRPAVVLAVFELEPARLRAPCRWLVAFATHATGKVRLQVTGNPPTTSAFGLCCVQAHWPSGRAAAIMPWSTARRERMYGLMAPRSYIQRPGIAPPSLRPAPSHNGRMDSAGHRIRVMVARANFPRLSRNLHTRVVPRIRYAVGDRRSGS